MRFSKKMVLGVAVYTVLFTIIVLWLSYMDKMVPDTLIAGVFGVSAAEGGLLALLKRSENAKSSDIDG